jgi:hypothetical protein
LNACANCDELVAVRLSLGTSLLEGPEGPQHVKTNSVATGAHTALHSIILRAVIAFLLFPRFPCGFECRAAFALFVQTAKTKADSDLFRVDSDSFFARILCQDSLPGFFARLPPHRCMTNRRTAYVGEVQK